MWTVLVQPSCTVSRLGRGRDGGGGKGRLGRGREVESRKTLGLSMSLSSSSCCGREGSPGWGVEVWSHFKFLTGFGAA